MKLTKSCIYPWTVMSFFADGEIQPCCGGVERYTYGNILDDNPSELFTNKEYQKLRSSLLTGDLKEVCTTCRLISDPDITLEQFRIMLTKYLISKGRIITPDTDLTKEFAFDEVLGNITNKCMFSCIYCLLPWITQCVKVF